MEGGLYRGTHLLAHGFLLVTRINGNDVQAHSLRVLLGKRTQTTARADNGDSLSWADL